MNQDIVQHIVHWDYVRNFHKDLHNTKSIRELIARKHKHVTLHTENIKLTKKRIYIIHCFWCGNSAFISRSTLNLFLWWYLFETSHNRCLACEYERFGWFTKCNTIMNTKTKPGPPSFFTNTYNLFSLHINGRHKKSVISMVSYRRKKRLDLDTICKSIYLVYVHKTTFISIWFFEVWFQMWSLLSFIKVKRSLFIWSNIMYMYSRSTYM